MSRKKYVAVPTDGAAWITGASSGIGRHLALDLARNGWKVAVTARSEDALKVLKAEAVDLGGEIHVFAGDVRDGGLMASHCSEIAARLGGPALVIANAGIYLPQDGLSGKIADYLSTFEVNLMGTVNVVLPAIDLMKQARQGQIALVSSVAGYRGLPTSAAYGASKAGLINMAESLKFDLDRAGITIQVINPGFVDTPATQSNPFPMPYLISPEEAVCHISKGLSAPDRFEIAFPKPLVRQLKVLKILPSGLYFKLVGKATGWDRKMAE